MQLASVTDPPGPDWDENLGTCGGSLPAHTSDVQRVLGNNRILGAHATSGLRGSWANVAECEHLVVLGLSIQSGLTVACTRSSPRQWETVVYGACGVEGIMRR